MPSVRCSRASTGRTAASGPTASSLPERGAGRRVRVSGLLFDAIAPRPRGRIDRRVPSTRRSATCCGSSATTATSLALPADAAGPALVFERVPGWRTVELDRAGRAVRTAPGVELDLGSTGKALAADLAAAAAHRLVRRAGGCPRQPRRRHRRQPASHPSDGWPVRVGEDSRADPSTAGEVVDLHSGDALATSSTTVRRWTAGGPCGTTSSTRGRAAPPRAHGGPPASPRRTCVDANAAVDGGDRPRRPRGPAGSRSAGLPARLVGRDGAVMRVARLAGAARRGGLMGDINVLWYSTRGSRDRVADPVHGRRRARRS